MTQWAISLLLSRSWSRSLARHGSPTKTPGAGAASSGTGTQFSQRDRAAWSRPRCSRYSTSSTSAGAGSSRTTEEEAPQVGLGSYLRRARHRDGLVSDGRGKPARLALLDRLRHRPCRARDRSTSQGDMARAPAAMDAGRDAPTPRTAADTRALKLTGYRRAKTAR